MKTLIVALILLSFVQSSFLGINLIALCIIARSLVVDDSTNLYLAFFFGLLLGVLIGVNIGFYSISFLILSIISTLVKRSPLSSNILTVVPLSLFLISLLSLLEGVFLKISPNVGLILTQSVLSLPIFLVIRFWEERFIPKEGVKLKI